MSAIIEFLSKLWSPRSNNRGSRCDSRKGGGETLAITELLSRRKKPAGGYFMSSVGQRQNDAIRGKKKKKEIRLFFFSPHPPF